MKRRIALLFTIAALCVAGVGSAAVPNAADSPVVVAKPCGSGYTHASLPWGHKCLRRGQYCKISGDRYYHRYGYHCHTGRLT